MTQRLHELWVFVARDPINDKEGLCGGIVAGRPIPLVTGMFRLVPLYRAAAYDVLQNAEPGTTIRLVRFNRGEEIEELRL